jgi:Tfp pilus assembly protein PilF
LSAFKSLAIWFAWCIPVIWIGRQAQPAGLLESPPAFRPVIALDAIAFYAGKVFLPFGLVLDYGRSPRWLMTAVDRFWTWIAPVALLTSGVMLRRRTRWPLAIVLIFIAALLPVLGLVRFDFQMFSTVADHYLYLAMLAPAVAVAVICTKIQPKNLLLSSPLLVIVAAISMKQCAYWRDTRTLFEHNYEVNPTSLAAAGILGMYWTQNGDPDQGLGILAQSVVDHPTVPFAHFTYANVLMERGLIPQAIREFQQAITLDASKPEYFRNFGVALDKSGHPELAAMAFDRATKLAPGDADNFQNAGIALAKIGRIDDAKRYLRRTLEIDPSRTQVRDLLQTLATTRPATTQ